MNKVNIIHFNHNTKSNFNVGDEAHVLSIQSMLEATYKNGEIEFINLPIDLLSHWKTPYDVLKTKILFFQTTLLNIKLFKNPLSQLAEICNQSDMVLIGGGGIYMNYLLPFSQKLLEMITVPIVIYGVGYNHNFGDKLLSDQQIESIFSFGKKAQLQSVRDKITFDLLAGYGVESTLICDPAVFLEDKQGSSITKHDHTIEPTLMVGFNIAAHGWAHQREYENKLIEIYSEIAKKISHSKPVKFFYFVHHPNELKVVKRLEHNGVFFQEIIHDNAIKTRNMYKYMDITISMMLHSTILAFSAGVPSISIGYDDKNKSFMQLTGQENRYIDVRRVTSGNLLDLINLELLSHKENLKSLKKYKSTLKLKQEGFNKLVANILSGK